MIMKDFRAVLIMIPVIFLAVCSAKDQLESRTAPSKQAEELVPLKLKLPKAVWVGTPISFRGKPRTTALPKPERRKPFLVPRDVKNVALKKPVSLSVDGAITGEARQITDGVKEATNWDYVELEWGPQYVQIDLQAVHEIFAVVFWHYHGEPRVYRDVVVRAANDPDFITDVRTLFNNDQDNTSGLGVGKDREYLETYEGKLVDCFADRTARMGTRARYFRFYSNGSTADEMNHYIEVEVWGRPAGSDE